MMLPMKLVGLLIVGAFNCGLVLGTKTERDVTQLLCPTHNLAKDVMRRCVALKRGCVRLNFARIPREARRASRDTETDGLGRHVHGGNADVTSMFWWKVMGGGRTDPAVLTDYHRTGGATTLKTSLAVPT